MTHRLRNDADTVGGLLGQRFGDRGGIGCAGDRDLVKAGQAGFQRRQRLLHRFVDRAADRHCFTDRLHRRGQVRLRACEFFERKARDLGDDIVDCRLEGRRGHAGDVVVQLVQRIADCQFRRDLGNRETRSLGRQRRRTRHAGVHFDHDHPAVSGVNRPLHVRAASFDANLAQHRDGLVAHDLVFFVGQRQGRGDGDRIARVHAHGIDVFNRANDDRVVRLVAHDFHLELFPAEQGFVDKDLRHGGRFHAGAAVVFVLFAVIRHAAAGAAKGKGGADDGGQADIFDRFNRQLQTGLDVELAVLFLGGGDDRRFGVFDSKAVHRFAEQPAILCHFNGFALCADHFDAEFFQHAHVGQRQ